VAFGVKGLIIPYIGLDYISIQYWIFLNILEDLHKVITEFSTSWLTDKPTDAFSHNSTMERAMCLISSLLDVTSSQDVPFCQLQPLHSKHHGATYLCSSSFHWQCKVSICNCTKWFPTGFFWSNMDSLQRSFLHCYLSITLCNKQSIATNEV